ncbi:hypothetical protein EJB05_14087, partial [Eragrostis curvula]
MRTLQSLYQKATGKRSAESSGSGRSRVKARGSKGGGRRRVRGSRAPSPAPSVHESEEEREREQEQEEEEEQREQQEEEEQQEQEASEEQQEEEASEEDGDGEEEDEEEEEDGEEQEASGDVPSVWERGPARLPPRPIPIERRPLVRPKEKKGWETIVPGDHKRLPAGILGLLCRRHFPGMVPLSDGGEEPALTWAHYKRVADVPDEGGRDFRTVADRVVGELWDFFRVEPEWSDRAVRRAYNACPKLNTDMHYEARVQAMRTYYAKQLGRKIEKKEARTIWLAAEQYMQVIPWWCASHRDCWEYFVSRWCDPEWQKMHESQAHQGRPCPPLMAWAMAHKGKASSIEVDYNPEDGPEAYSNPTVHTRLSQYTEMAREKHGPEWDPSTEDLDGEIIMKVGGGPATGGDGGKATGIGGEVPGTAAGTAGKVRCEAAGTARKDAGGPAAANVDDVSPVAQWWDATAATTSSSSCRHFESESGHSEYIRWIQQSAGFPSQCLVTVPSLSSPSSDVACSCICTSIA